MNFFSIVTAHHELQVSFAMQHPAHPALQQPLGDALRDLCNSGHIPSTGDTFVSAAEPQKWRVAQRHLRTHQSQTQIDLAIEPST